MQVACQCTISSCPFHELGWDKFLYLGFMLTRLQVANTASANWRTLKVTALQTKVNFSYKTWPKYCQMAVSLFCFAQGKVQPWPFVPFLALFGATHLLLQLLSEPLATPCPYLVLASLLCMVICSPHPFCLKPWLMKQVAVIIKSTCCSLQHHHFLLGASAISSFHCLIVGTTTNATTFPTVLPFLQRE